jgi:multiple sugar transport system substrate-binding protein
MSFPNRRKLMFGAASAALTGVSAWGGPVADHGKRRHAKHLRVLAPRGCEANLRPVTTAVEAKTGVQVSLMLVPVDEINSVILLDQMTGQKAFDVALPATFGIPDLVDAGALLSLDDYARQYETPDVTEGMLYRIGDSFDGQLYGYQTDGDTYLMFYNTEMMDDPALQGAYGDTFGAALDIPSSWAQIDQQMAFLNTPDENRWGGLMFRNQVYTVSEWWCRFHAYGKWPMAPDLDPLIASDEGVAALEDMIRSTAHLARYNQQLVGNWKFFEAGTTYCNIGWGGMQKFLNKPGGRMRGKLRHSATPGITTASGEHVEIPYFNWGWTYVVAASSPVPDLAYQFCSFAVTPEISTRAVRQSDGFFDPFRSEHYEDDGIAETYSRSFLDIHKASLQSAIPDFYVARRAEYIAALSRWITRALLDDMPPREALERAADEWRIINTKINHTDQSRRWRQLCQKYPASLRAAFEAS